MPPHLLDPFHIFILLAAFLTLAVAASASLAKGPSNNAGHNAAAF